MNLYEIANEYRIIDQSIDVAGGELTPEIEKALTELDATLADKVDGIGVVITESIAKGDAYTDEAERLKGRAKTAYAKAEGLRSYLLRALTHAGKKNASGALFSVSRQLASRPAIRWSAQAPIPRSFVRIREELDSEKAFDAYKAGGLPDGFTVERKEFVTIR